MDTQIELTRNLVRRRILAYTMITISAVLYTLGLQAFLQVAQTFSAGLGAIAALPTFIFPALIPYVSFIYLGLNIPIVAYYWNKNKRKFMYRTIYFLLLQGAFGSIFLIPHLHSNISNLLNITPSVPGGTIRDEVWPILVLAVMGALFIGMAIGISWKFGGSTGGTDIVTYYYSTKKQIDIGSMMFIIAIAGILISFSVSIAFNENIRKYWLITLFSSCFYVFINSLIINWIYPKYKKVLVSVVSTKSEEISNFFKSDKYHHAWQIEKVVGGYSGSEKNRITTIIFLLESKELIRKILIIDPKAWISLTRVNRVIGELNATKLDEGV